MCRVCEWLKARKRLERQPVIDTLSAVYFHPIWPDPSSPTRLILSACHLVMEYPLQSVNLLFTRRKPTAPTYRLPFPIPTQPFRIHPISSRKSFGRRRPALRTIQKKAGNMHARRKVPGSNLPCVTRVYARLEAKLSLCTNFRRAPNQETSVQSDMPQARAGCKACTSLQSI